MTVKNNYIHHCSQTFEFWSIGSEDAPGFRNIRVVGNRCERAGYSVFSDVRPDQAVRVHLLTYDLQTPVDIVIERNIFDGAFGAYRYHAYPPPKGFVTRDNVIKLAPGQRLQYQRDETIERAPRWQKATSQEERATFKVLS